MRIINMLNLEDKGYAQENYCNVFNLYNNFYVVVIGVFNKRKKYKFNRKNGN